MEQTINLNNLLVELKKIEEAMVTKQDMGRFMETLAIMSNEDTMQQIAGSEKDIASGRIKEVNSVDDL